MADPKELIRKNILAMLPYSTARDEYQGDVGVYLDANENPYDNGFNRYPDPRQKLLKQKISEIKGISTKNIFVGNGSDEPIDLVYRVFCEPRIDNVVSITPTYGMYKVAASINDVEFREVQLQPDFSINVDALLAATDTKTKVIFLCSPNNPTGNDLRVEDIELLLSRFGGMVMVDEAYIDFSAQPSFLECIDKYPNLIILQTLSKAWGLAGLRLGLAFAREDVVDLFSRVKYPYNINGITQAIVLKELDRPIGDMVEEIVQQRCMLMGELVQIPIIKNLYPSDANFILAQFDDPKKIYNTLIDSGIIVRNRSSVVGCSGCLRITVGTPEENGKLLEILRKQ